MVTQSGVAEIQTAIDRLRDGGEPELSRQFARIRPSLARMIAFRSCPQLRQRVDHSDIVQDSYLEAVRRLDQYLAAPNVSPDVWLRQVSRQVLARHYRQHFAVAKRSIQHDQPLEVGGDDRPDYAAILLADSITSPESAASRKELCGQVRQLLMSLDEDEREVLCMKQLEGLTFDEIATQLDISVSAAKRRMCRALEHFRQLTTFLETTPK